MLDLPVEAAGFYDAVSTARLPPPIPKLRPAQAWRSVDDPFEAVRRNAARFSDIRSSTIAAKAPPRHFQLSCVAKHWNVDARNYATCRRLET
jgi:hypothetical protein